MKSPKNRSKAKRDLSQHLDPVIVPEGYAAKGVSVLRDAKGEIKMVWTKTKQDGLDPYSFGEQVAAGLTAGGISSVPTITPQPALVRDQLSVYPLGDPHIGLYAWAEEAGEDFDLEIAERQYLTAAALLFDRAIEGTDALIIDLGDFFHADDPQYRTSSGRNTVDVDTRYERVIVVGIRIMRALIDAALLKHHRVLVWCLRGNHDDRSTLTLREAIRGIYEGNKRVIIDTTPGKVHALEFGRNLILGTHGDTIRGKRGRTMLEIATADHREAWGRTRHARAYLGHVHHESVQESGGLVTETFRTLAPKDAWHAACGYRSGRDTRLDVWHRDYGLQSRHIVSIDEIKEGMKKW